MRNLILIISILCLILFAGCSIIKENAGIIKNDNSSLQDEGVENLQKGETQNAVSVYADSNKDVVKSGSLTNRGNSEMRYTTLYYRDSSGIFIPITRKTSRVEGIAKAVLYALKDTPVNREDIKRIGLFPVFPTDFFINGMTIKDGIAVVDINDKIDEDMMKAMTYSLAEFDNINQAKILVKGYECTDIYREGINTNINRNRKNSKDAGEEDIEVYFTKLVENKYLYYVPVSRKITISTGDTDKYLKTINELIKGDTGNKDIKSYVPDKSVLKGIQVDGQTVTIDFNDAILNADISSVGFNNMLKQILLCFKQFGKVKKVRITVNGKSLQLPGEYAGKESLEVPVHANIL
jgi:germination protein M